MENLQKRPSKGILRTTSNSGQLDHAKTSIEPIKWDEMNIMQTLHPPGKDYGHMKIEEPKTPFSHYKDTIDGEPVSDDEELASSSTANLDIQTISDAINQCKSKILHRDDSGSKEEESDENCESDSDLSEEEKKKRKEFEMKRKMHYNEFQAVKLARKLLEEDDEEDEEEDATMKKTDSVDNDEGMASDREVEQDYADLSSRNEDH